MLPSTDDLSSVPIPARGAMPAHAAWIERALVRPGAVDAYRALKPGIALVADHGIPVRDELRLVVELPPPR
jgi:hypothetical protein